MWQDRGSRPAGVNRLASPFGRGAAGPAPAAPRVGAELRAARLRLDRRVPDLAAGLRIKPAHLEALEEGRIADLPGAAYAAGFVRAYAGALGLDPDALARRFHAETRGTDRRSVLAFPAPVPERGVPAGAAVLLGVVLAVGGYAGWYRLSEDVHAPVTPVPPVPERLASLARGGPPSAPSPHVASILPPAGPAPPARPVPAQAAPERPEAERAEPQTAGPAPPVPPATVSPIQAAAAPPSPAPPRAAGQAQAAPADGRAEVRPEERMEGHPDGRPEGRVVLRAKADVWMQVRERQGPSVLNRLLRAGETWPVPAGQALLLTTGNAGGTEVLVDGEAVAPLGGSGAVRRDVSLDPEALKAVDAKAGDAPKAGQNAGQPGARAAAPASTSRPPAQ